MKKLAILFLLTAVIVSFTFAQVSLKADFSVANINKGNTAIQDRDPTTGTTWATMIPTPGTTGQIGYADPVLTLIFGAKGTQQLGPGALGFEGALGIKNSFHDTDYGIAATQSVTSRVNAQYLGGNGISTTDDTYAGITYGLGVGPGNLGFGMAYKFDPDGPAVFNDNDGTYYNYIWTLEPNVSYTGLNVGPVSIGAGFKYDYKFNGISTDNATGTEKAASFFHPYGEARSADQIVFWFDIDTAFGLYIYYEFDYGWGKDATGRSSFYRAVFFNGGAPSSGEMQGQREIVKIAKVDIQYKLGGLATVGLEVDDTGPGFRGSYLKVGSASSLEEFNTETTGFTLKPKVDFTVGSIGFGAYLKFAHIMPTNVDQELQLTPGAYVKYTL